MAGSTYKIRKLHKPGAKGNDYEAASIAVPKEIAMVLPENVKFSVELTEDGILYKPMATPASAELPSWIKPAAEEPKTKTSASKA